MKPSSLPLRRPRLGLALLTAWALACATTPPDVRAGPRSELALRVVFSTGLDEHNDPIDSRQQLHLAEDRIVVHISWLDIDPGAHHYKLAIHDGSGQLVSVQRMDFEVDAATWTTLSWYRPKPGVDAPGSWRFAVFLDEVLVAEPRLTVLP